MNNAKNVGYCASLVATLAVLACPCVAETNHYVDANSATPTPPYTNWLTAAHTIQDAIDAAAAGATVWVTDGIYESGGVAGYPAGSSLTNRVAIHRPLTVRAVSTNPADTVILGRGPIGSAAVRGVYMVEGAVLANFTVKGCATFKWGDERKEASGGGLWAEGLGAIVSNCCIQANSADQDAGGAYRGTFLRCIFQENWTDEGDGGGASWSALHNCTLAGNSAFASFVVPPDGAGGGVSLSTLTNCVVYYNAAYKGNGNYDASSLATSCTIPLPAGQGNIADSPLFVNPGSGYGLDHQAGDYRLLADSPCINAGRNEAWMTDASDLDGVPRIVGPAVDMGAYEYPLTPSGISGVWLRDHGLPTDGSADLADTDGDGMNNRGEYEADTIPTDVDSVLRFLAIGEQWGGTRLDWQGGRDAWQFLEIRERLTSTGESWTAIYAIPPPTPQTNARKTCEAIWRRSTHSCRATGAWRRNWGDWTWKASPTNRRPIACGSDCAVRWWSDPMTRALRVDAQFFWR